MTRAALFPGQGSQYVGMAKDLHKECDDTKKFYATANDILGFDIAEISFEGPDEKLKQTQFTQPAIFMHSVVLAHMLKSLGFRAAACAGHSLGEFSALVFAGVLSFEDALRVVNVRSSEMAHAGEKMPGSMAAIIGASAEQADEVCKVDGIVVPANFNSDGQIIISGEISAIKAAIVKAKEMGIRRAMELNVSGAFHSPLMTPAREPLQKVLESVEFKDAEVPVYQNVCANAVRDASQIKENILKQLENPVLWQQSVQAMIVEGITEFVEIGPGKVLNGLTRRIDRSASTKNFDTFEQVENYKLEA